MRAAFICEGEREDGGETLREYETDNSDLLLSLTMSITCERAHTHTHNGIHNGHSLLQAV